MIDDFEWIQIWYQTHCDEKWEQEYGILIKTIDNPGWRLTINLIGTECEGHPFTTVENEIDEMNWYVCFIRDKNFEAACGPCNLAEILRVFRKWVELCKAKAVM